MIEIRISDCCVTAKGHAGFAPEGQDIVCAGVSALLYTAGRYLRAMDQAGKLRTAPTVRLNPGDVKLEAKPKAVNSRECETVFRFLELGLTEIAGKYPGYISIHAARIA